MRLRKPYRLRRKKSILRNRFFWLGILTLVIAGTIFYFLFFSEIFQVKQIIITGEERVSKEDLKLLIEKKVKNRLLFFKTKSIFLVNSDEMEKDILNNFPQINRVKIYREFPDTFNIVITERLASAIFCREDNCFLLDNEGIIFDPIRNTISNGVKIIDKKDIIFFNLGEKVIEESILASIFDIKEQLKGSFEISIEEFIIPDRGRLNVIINKGWEIYFNTQEDIDWQLTKLNLVLKEEIPPERRENLEYIDLRFSRVYYKYK